MVSNDIFTKCLKYASGILIHCSQRSFVNSIYQVVTSSEVNIHVNGKNLSEIL